MDGVERTLALKRIGTWPREWKADVICLTAPEVEVMGLLVALLDARPDAGGKAGE